MMVEQALDDRLAIIKCAFNSDGMNIGGSAGCHLPTLHVRYPPLRIKNKDVDLRQASKGLNSCRTRVARCRPYDGGAAIAATQLVIHHPAQPLHRHILEGEC